MKKSCTLSHNMKYFKTLTIIILIFIISIVTIYGKSNEQLTIQEIKKQDKVIFGRIEKGYIKSANAKFTIKMDTGAKIASLDVKKLQYFKKNDEKWVRFTITSRTKRKKLHKILINTDVIIEKPVIDFVTIKKHFKNQKIDQRPVINLDITVGNTTETIRANLVSRKNFLYPMLFGREAINKFNAIIDPKKIFLQKLILEKNTEKENNA